VGRIFISYRRDDSADVTGRIYDRIERRYGRGRLFLDVDSIPLGEDFRRHLDSALDRCSVMVVVIGDRWLDARYDQGPKSGRRRLDDPDDYVALELRGALMRNIPVVPVLVGRATMPRAESLPPDLGSLVYRQATEVRSGADFGAQVDRLLRALEPHARPRPALFLRRAVPIAALLAALGIAVVLSRQFGSQRDDDVGPGGRMAPATSLVVEEPLDGALLSSRDVRVRGRAIDGGDFALSVESVPSVVTGGRFDHALALPTDGRHEIVVTHGPATDPRRHVEIRRVTVDTTPPRVWISQPPSPVSRLPSSW
jgi:hypothetical protein